MFSSRVTCWSCQGASACPDTSMLNGRPIMWYGACRLTCTFTGSVIKSAGKKTHTTGDVCLLPFYLSPGVHVFISRQAFHEYKTCMVQITIPTCFLGRNFANWWQREIQTAYLSFAIKKEAQAKNSDCLFSAIRDTSKDQTMARVNACTRRHGGYKLSSARPLSTFLWSLDMD